MKIQKSAALPALIYCLFPALVFVGISFCAGTICRLILAEGPAVPLICALTGSMAAIPVLLFVRDHDLPFGGGTGLTSGENSRTPGVSSRTPGVNSRICFLPQQSNPGSILARAAGYTVLGAVISAAFGQVLGMLEEKGFAVPSAGQQMLLQGPLWLKLMALCLMVPLAEELCYRGLVYGRMSGSFSQPAAVIFSSLLFAAGHEGIPQAIYAFLMGIILCGCLRREKSLYPAAAFHLGANLITILWK